ncbi:RhoGAP-domain-containing protein [Saitoella complicata NRRL Y-17804]|uniref:RhoGAP-domain-containing protein n=1 Tax=Saitoella complicata (strain BCRC 22490 / CBS 7301 / JCM 7358 / NBRC 10748 / NRRL Y-17804) TaxID=698492 RepID=UPI00086800AB|nr:RhoGAP-domain-containing protein [Saitoella complicata NRRL Y-17804]ODQ50564.1 RhoGAP-domain-containing protein [Saitoella complicata NRRL Y-17804]
MNDPNQPDGFIPPGKPVDEAPSLSASADDGWGNILLSDAGLDILLQRAKQSVASGKELASFLRKRAQLEEEHARGLQRLYRQTQENLRKPEVKQQSFSRQIISALQVHDKLVENSLSFVNQLHEMVDEIDKMAKTTHATRKQLKETGLRSERNVVDADKEAEKSKAKYESICEEYDRTLALKANDVAAKKSNKTFGFKSSKSGSQLVKHEEETRSRAESADREYKEKVRIAHDMREELLHQLRPRLARQFQDLISESDSTMSFQLQKYGFLQEALLLNHGVSISPAEPRQNGEGLRNILADIQDEEDFVEYVTGFSSKASVPQRSEVHYEAHASLHPPATPENPTFGVHLRQLTQSEGTAVPHVVIQCCTAVDKFGLDVQGIYRLSGTASQIQKIKNMFDEDAENVVLNSPDDFFGDINGVTGALKSFFRELPDPLSTNTLYPEFIQAAKIDDDVQRRDALHAVVNKLPDPNYGILRYLCFHLHRVQQNEAANKMPITNLAIVFGPTLMGSGGAVADMGWQCRVVETILSYCYDIFESE